jgi:hypothetical protein
MDLFSAFSRVLDNAHGTLPLPTRDRTQTQEIQR